MTVSLRGRRGVSTVADVSLAILVLVAAIAVLATFADGTERTHDPSQGPNTAETLGASTVNASYSMEPVLAADEFPGDNGYSDDELQRVSHGPIAGQVGAGAVSNVTFDVHTEPTPLSIAGSEYVEAIDEAVQASLVESSFESNVSGDWQPYEGASIRGEVAVGQQPPPEVETSLTTLAVPSGIPDLREEALGAVENEDDYGTVARIAAEALIERLVPRLESQRALESSGLERELAVYRYRRVATVVDRVSPDDEAIAENLERESADTAALNKYLTGALAVQLNAELEATFETAQAAARALRMHEVTVTVRTWDP